MYTYKVMLLPNNKQKTKIFKTFNKCIECQNIIFDILDKRMQNKEGLPKCTDLRRQFTLIKKEKDQEVINNRIGLTKKEIRDKHLDILFYDVSNDALKQTIKDTYNAFVRFLKKLGGYPKRKKYNYYYKSFYVDPYKIDFTNDHVKLEKITTDLRKNRKQLNYIKLAEKGRIPVEVKYYNPRVVYSDNRLWICVAVDDEYRPKKKTHTNIYYQDKTIGIDMNVDNIVTSDGIFYNTGNKDKKIKKIEEKIKELHIKLSRKYEQAKKDKRKLITCKNFIKTKKQLKHYSIKLKHLRENRDNEIISDILKSPPKQIAIETLSVKEMMETKVASKGMQKTGFRKFINYLKNRIRYLDIKLIEIPQFYASSKTCSGCGYKKNDLSLEDREYNCPNCGLKINRDYNAAINIRNYALKNI